MRSNENKRHEEGQPLNLNHTLGFPEGPRVPKNEVNMAKMIGGSGIDTGKDERLHLSWDPPPGRLSVKGKLWCRVGGSLVGEANRGLGQDTCRKVLLGM